MSLHRTCLHSDKFCRLPEQNFRVQLKTDQLVPSHYTRMRFWFQNDGTSDDDAEGIRGSAVSTTHRCDSVSTRAKDTWRQNILFASFFREQQNRYQGRRTTNLEKGNRNVAPVLRVLDLFFCKEILCLLCRCASRIFWSYRGDGLHKRCQRYNAKHGRQRLWIKSLLNVIWLCQMLKNVC